MATVFAKVSASIAWSGGKMLLKKDQPWDAESALVKERPDLFTDEPERVAGRPRRGRAVIERATRAPGEMRETKRPRKADGGGADVK